MSVGECFGQAINITFLVLVMMLLVDYFDVRTRGRLRALARGGRWRQYILASFLGATPGCLGAFMSVTLYVHGVLILGAMVACMVATSGDEAFVMLVMFPRQAVLLFLLLFVLGIIFGRISDWVVRLFQVVTCEKCKLQEYHAGEETVSHYIRDHVWKHIIKRHIWRVFIWTFLALLIVGMGVRYWELDAVVTSHLGTVLILSALVGIIPESGPNLIFVTLYAHGTIPFSVLLTNAIVQDGHGMLPLLSYTLKDSLLIKTLNMIFGLSVGGGAYLLGF